jgi:hypothetical protein
VIIKLIDPALEELARPIESRFVREIRPERTPTDSPPALDTRHRDDDRFIDMKAARKLTALSMGYLSKLCSQGTIRTNGIKGRGLRIDVVSLAEFMKLRDEDR